MTTTIVFHIAAGALSLIAGYVALFAAKGAVLHRKSGRIFVYAMLTMSLSGALIAAIRATEASVIAGLLTAYLVTTAWIAVRPKSRRVDLALMAIGLAVGVAGFTFGFQAASTPTRSLDGIPAAMLFLFGTVALSAGASDLRVVRNGALQGTRRLRRHLWRMCFALWIAAASFFFGQADELPNALRIPALLAIPPMLALLLMIYWLWRVRARSTFADTLTTRRMNVKATLGNLIIAFVIATTGAQAQENPFSTDTRGLYNGVKKILMKSAEAMPEENYGYRPTEAVRTYGQIVGHAADAQYLFCSAALGEKNPGLQIEKTKTSKAELIAALAGAIAYCDKAYDGMTDASGAQTVKFMGGDKPRLGVLQVNNVHSIEHYGNLIVYLRMNNIVPPTSDPEFMKSLMK